MTISELREKYSELRRRGKLHGTIKRAVQLRQSRDENQPLEPAKPGRILEYQRYANRTPNRIVVPLGAQVAAEWMRTAQADNRRLQEWSLGAEATTMNYGYGYNHHTTGSNSDWHKKSTFRRGIKVTCYVPAGQRLRTKEAVFVVGTETHRIPAPYGYRWIVDDNGLALVGKAGDYHPTASDLLQGGKYCVARLKELAAVRKTEAKKQRQQLAMIKRAEAEGATVCMRDSLKAGNCHAGTLNWIRRHDLNESSHYAPSKLLSMANGDAKRVGLVVAFALRRHQAEMDRGYCELGDHR